LPTPPAQADGPLPANADAAPTNASPTPGISDADEDAIRAVLQRYARAYSTADTVEIRTIFPSIPTSQLVAIEANALERGNQNLEFSDVSIHLAQDGALVSGTARLRSSSDTSRAESVRASMMLARLADGTWVFTSIDLRRDQPQN
jgi:ketosteroid isomerase-like protein